MTRALSPSRIVLLVAALCFVGLVWGAVTGNWVLVATEVPAVLALVGIWATTRANRSGNRAAIVGSLCAVELWIATAVFDARGMTLAVIVALSTGLTIALAAMWAIRTRGPARVAVPQD